MRKGKGKEAKLVFIAHALMDNRHGLVNDFRLTEVNGTAERGAALEIAEMKGPIRPMRSLRRPETRSSAAC